MRRAMAIMLMLAATGCAEESARPVERVIDATYTVRGVVVELPSDQVRGSELRIQHEAISGLVGPDGDVIGMPAMTMSFKVADGLSLDGLAVGDGVEFDMEVWWKPTTGYQITAIKKLPAEMELESGGVGGHEHHP